MRKVSLENAAILLKKSGVGILPTDTLYGLVASAMDREAVERVYRIRGRDDGKPCIVLIGNIADLGQFDIHGGPEEMEFLESMWPGKVSVVLSCAAEEWAYLHRGTKTLAFRLPDRDDLRELLRKAGPIIAPSANRQGEPPAKTIDEAEAYFGDTVDFFVDGGALDSEPSTVVRFDGGKITVIREGAVHINN